MHFCRLSSYVILTSVAVFWGLVSPSMAQHISQLNPLRISFRAVDVSPSGNEIFGGDSSMFLMVRDNSWSYLQYFDKSVTIYAAAFADDQHVVLGGTKGKIFFSTNTGTTWGLATIGSKATIRSLTTNGAGTFFGVGDSGIIISSSDFGRTWDRIASPVTKQLNAIRFGGSGTYAVAVGNDSAIIQSTDGGMSWSVVPMPYDLRQFGSAIQRVDFTALAMAPTDDSVWVGMERPVMPMLIIKGHPDPNAKLTLFPGSGPLTSMLYIGQDPAYGWHVAAFAADDYAYSDTGVTGWVRGPFGNGSDADGNPYVGVLRYRAAALNWWNDTIPVVYLAGDDVQITLGEILGGSMTTYDQIPPGHGSQANFFAVSVLPDGTGFGTGMGGRMYETNDSGRNWYHRSNTFSGSPLIGVASIDAYTAVACGWGGLLVRTSDGGSTFDTLPSGTQEKLHSVAFPSSDTGIIVGDYGYILRSTDQGLSWTSIPTPTTKFLYSVAFPTPDIGIATGDGGTILRTADRGSTWSEINNVFSGTSASLRQVEAFPNGTLYIRGQNSLIRSSNFGISWAIVNCPGDSLGMDWFNPQIGITGERSTSSETTPDTAYVHITTDGGSRWIPVTIPIWHFGKLLFHWLNDHQVLAYGANGFVVEVEIGEIGSVVMHPSGERTLGPVAAYPNPATGTFHLTYATTSDGLTTIELCSEDGKRIETLFKGEEQVGTHEHVFEPNDPGGAYFIKVNTPESSSIIPVSLTR